MNALLEEMLRQSQDAFWVFGLVFLRVGAMVSVLPAFGEQMIPARIKLAVALTLAVLAAPLVEVPVLEGAPPPELAGLFLTEMGIGLLFGITLRFLSHCLLIAGSIAAQSTSLSQLFGGSAASEPQPAIANLIYIAGLMLIVFTGLHIKLIWALVLLYDLLPVGSILSGRDVSDWGVDVVAKTFALAFVLSAPFVLASLLYNVAMGVINKAMPQLMVAFVGAPAITAGGLLVLLLSLPVLLPIWHERFEAVMMSPLVEMP